MDPDKLREDIEFKAELCGHELRFRTTWGLFSPREIDAGTRLLLRHIEVEADSDCLDLGCGYGSIGLALAACAPRGDTWLVDKDFVAVDYARRNARENGLTNVRAALANGFDGRCLTVTREDGEPALTEVTLQQVREVARQRTSSTGARNEIEHLKIGSVGKRNHPVIESSFVVRTKAGVAIARVLEFLVPTGGKTLRFSYRASPRDFAEAEPVFRRSAATLQIAAPAEGRKELSDKLKMPLIIGGVVGLIFLVLYKLRKH